MSKMMPDLEAIKLTKIKEYCEKAELTGKMPKITSAPPPEAKGPKVVKPKAGSTTAKKVVKPKTSVAKKPAAPPPEDDDFGEIF